MKGILFNSSTGMLKAVIEGKKTMTRRIVKPQPDDDGLWNHTDFPMALESKLKGWHGTVMATGESIEFKPRYKLGETVYVKESYTKEVSCGETTGYVYRHGFDDKYVNDPILKWSNPMFCGEKQARYFLKITDIKVERLHDISNEDCYKEGVPSYVLHCVDFFSDIINEINGKSCWSSNPWVFVYEFKKVN